MKINEKEARIGQSFFKKSLKQSAASHCEVLSQVKCLANKKELKIFFLLVGS